MSDVKTMAQATRNQPDAEVPVSLETGVHNSLVPGDFHDFKGNEVKAYTTYENRQGTIAQKLGSKSPLVS